MPRSATRVRRRGNAIVVVLCLTSLLGFSVMAIDVGFGTLAHAELQGVVDASALAAVGELDGTDAGLEAAVEIAIELSTLNAGGTMPLTAADITLGAYVDGAFIESRDASAINAVRISRESVPVLPVLSDGVFGETLAVRAEASAYRPIGGVLAETNCFLPIAVPECYFDGASQTVLRMEFTAEGAASAGGSGRGGGRGRGGDEVEAVDASLPISFIGWADPENANANNVKIQMGDTCSAETPVAIGDWIDTNNGMISSAQSVLVDNLNDVGTMEPDAWDAASWGVMPDRDGLNANLPADSGIQDHTWGHVIQGPVALVDAACDGTAKFGQEMQVVGFAWGALYDAKETASGGTKQNVFMLLDSAANPAYQVFGASDADGIGNVMGVEPAQLVE